MPNHVKPYSRFTDFDISLFKSGKHFRLYEHFGSHIVEHDGEMGVYFAVYAPAAKVVTVIGDFNFWAGDQHILQVRWDASGIWEGFVPGLKQGDKYKYRIFSNHDGVVTEKADPYARYCEHPPYTASLDIKAPKDTLIIASIAKEVITYPQTVSDEIFRKFPDSGCLERMFTSNDKNINEYTVASFGMTKAEIQKGTQVNIYITGLGFVMSRVNVVPTNAYVEVEKDEKK